LYQLHLAISSRLNEIVEMKQFLAHVAGRAEAQAEATAQRQQEEATKRQRDEDEEERKRGL